MKKKGLIISTVVMVVVLIASLTTATYAWFTASNKTEISGFNVSVVSSNAVNIGMKKEYSLSQNPSPEEFTTGSVTFTTGTTNDSGPGKINNPGSWGGGSDGLSATLEHNINWGSQAKAVGLTTSAEVTSEANASKATTANTRFWVTDTQNHDGSITYGNTTAGKTAVIAANKAQGSNDLTNQSLARANINGEGAGDYAHFILGVQPTKALDRNNFVIMISPSSDTSTLGILASIHVAYRVRKDGEAEPTWTEVDVYGTNKGTTKKGDITTNVTGTIATAYSTAIGGPLPAGSMACVISGLDTEVNKITQVEVVIYMAGADTDCNDQGKTASGDIKMFFDCANAETKATSAKLTSDTKLEIEGGETTYTATNTTVKIGEETIAGTWSDGKFTSTGTVTATAGTTKVVVQTQGKDAKELTIQAVSG